MLIKLFMLTLLIGAAVLVLLIITFGYMIQAEHKWRIEHDDLINQPKKTRKKITS